MTPSFCTYKMFLNIYNLDNSINEEPVCTLNQGEHVIGRGDLLKCHDKRASRAHAIINIRENNVTITSKHQHPCFFQSENSTTIVVLKRDVATELRDGDKFGIFPNEFWFRTKFQHKNIPTGNALKADETLTNTGQQTSLHKRALEKAIEDISHKIPKLENVETAGIHNTNSKACESNIRSDSSDTMVIEKRGPPGQKEELDLDIAISVSADSNKEDGNINSDNVNGVMIPVKNIDKSSILLVQELSNSDPKTPSGDLNGQDANLNEHKCDGDIQPIEADQSNTFLANPEVKVENVGSLDQSMPSSSGTASSTQAADNLEKPIRGRCWYGEDCYRKSMRHKKEFSHLGDSDYESDPKDIRPLCQYGAECYRKSKEHLKEYKHPKGGRKPSSKGGERRNRGNPKKPKTPADESSEDDYDYDDPFFNDDSEEEYEEESWSDDESDDDYSDINEQDDEDTRTLMKEAKRFKRQKK